MPTTSPTQISDILVNAQDMAVKHPETFYAPSQEELAAIKVGDCVKIEANLDFQVTGASGERFWVEVTKVNETSIVGFVANHLIWTPVHNLYHGLDVEFDFSAVMNILGKDEA